MTARTRTYCTVAQLARDLELTNIQETRLVDYIRAASQFVERRLGTFVPITETRNLDGNGLTSLYIDPLLAVTSIVDDGTTLTASDYLLYPPGGIWPNGPYTRLEIDPDGGRACWTRETGAIAVTGKWGMYEETELTGATVANAPKLAAGGTSLVVGNGSIISPGMVLLIDSEQMEVSQTDGMTDSTADLDENLDTSEELVDVTSGAAFNAGETIQIELEKMTVLGIAGNTLTVARGANGTTKTLHNKPLDIYVYRTFTVRRGCSGTTDAEHATGAAISRYVIPEDVNWLCRQIAGLMLKKAQSGFAGKTGDANLGEVFYNQEFPQVSLAEISRNYRIVGI